MFNFCAKSLFVTSNSVCVRFHVGDPLSDYSPRTRHRRRTVNLVTAGETRRASIDFLDIIFGHSESF